MIKNCVERLERLYSLIGQLLQYKNYYMDKFAFAVEGFQQTFTCLN